MNDELTGKVVRFTEDNGNEFYKGEIAVCLDGEHKKFLGLHGVNFGLVHYESSDFEVLGTDSYTITELLSKARVKYFS